MALGDDGGQGTFNNSILADDNRANVLNDFLGYARGRLSLFQLLLRLLAADWNKTGSIADSQILLQHLAAGSASHFEALVWVSKLDAL
jgi:hypothetical protein